MLWDVNGRSLEFAERTYRAWMDGTMRLQNEAMDFWMTSAGKNLTAATDLAKCATAAEAFERQSRYAQESFSDLLGEGRKMAEMLGEIVKENVTMLERAALESPAGAPRSGRH
jgi:hypothetical protein